MPPGRWWELRRLAISFAVTAASAEGQFIYDCAWCQKYQPRGYRASQGCRRDDPEALAVVPIDALEGEIVIDHCPGVLVDTPFIAWVFELDDARSLGYGLGDYDRAPAPQAESLITLARARRRVDQIMAKAEADANG